MNIVIYDYNDMPVTVEVPDKEISEIYVHILSGDETGSITFIDDTVVYFDASNHRFMSFDDGSYVVTGENINKWLNFKPSGDSTISYERQSFIWDLED